MAKNASGIVNAKSIGVVKGLIGSATATDANGVVRDLHEGDRVYANEVVQTSAAGTVHIEFNNSSYVNIGHGSTLALDKTVFDPNAKSGSGDDNLAGMRAKIAAGADPTEVTDPTAAGPTAGGDGGEQGGHNAVFVQQNAAQGSLSVSQGFETSSANNPQAAAGNEGAILRVNHDPVAEPGTAEAVEGGDTIVGNVIATDIDGDPLTYSLDDPAPAGLTFNPDGSYSFDPTDPAYDSMAQGDTQTITVNYTVADAFGGIDTSTLTITLTGTNDAATITASDTEDTAAVEAGGVANLVPGDPDASGTLTVSDVDHNENHFQTPDSLSLAGQYGTFTFDPDTGAWTYTLNNDLPTTQALTAGEAAQDVLTVASYDGTASYDITVNITGANDNATITVDGTPDTAVLEAGGVANGTAGDPNVAGKLTVTDVDNGEAAFQTPASLEGVYGTFTFIASTGEWTYTLNNDLPATQELNAGDPASDSLTVTSLDGTASQTITVNITGANDTAVVTGTATDTVREAGSGFNFGDPFASGNLDVSDVDAGEAHFQMPAANSLVGDYGVFLFNPINGAWTYILNNLSPATQALNAGDTAQDTLTVMTHDGTPQTITVNIIGTNDNAWIWGDDRGSVREAGGLNNASPGTQSTSGDLNIRDVDDGENHFATPTGDYSGTYGTFHFDNATGNWTYALDNGLPATEALTAGQRVQDKLVITSQDGTASQTITVTITGSNDAPTISAAVSDGDAYESGLALGTSPSSNTILASGTFTVGDVDGLGNIKSISIAGETFTIGAGGLAGLVGQDANTTHGTVTITGYANGVFNYEYTLTSATTDVDAAVETDSFVVTVTDNSNASANTTISVIIHDDAPQLIDPIAATINEGAYSTTVTGDLVHMGADVGPDVPGSYVTWTNLPTNLTSNGVAVTCTGQGTNTVTGMADGKVVFTLTGNPDGTYEYTQFSQLSSTISANFSQNLSDANAYYLYNDGTFNSTNSANDWIVKITAGSDEVSPTAGGLAVDSDGLDVGDWLNSGETMRFEFNEGADLTSAVQIAVNGLTDSLLYEKLNWTAHYTDGTSSSGSVDQYAASGTFTITAPDGKYLDSIDLVPNTGFLSLTYVHIESITVTSQQGLSFGFTATDGDGDPVNSTLTLDSSLIHINTPPTVDASAATAINEAADAHAQNLSVTGIVGFNDIDADDVIDISASYNNNIFWSGGTLTEAQLAALTGSGTFTASATDVDAPGSTAWAYSTNGVNLDFLAAGETITFSYTVTATDNHGATATDIVTITINGLNDAASITGTSTGSVLEAGSANNGGAPSVSGTLAVIDLDHGQSLFETATGNYAGNNGYGSFHFNAETGVWSYTLNNDAPQTQALAASSSVTDQMTVTTHDGTTKTVTVTIAGANDAPTITSGNGDTASINVAENTTAVMDVNATDPDGGTLQYTLSGADANLFNINTSSGVITFKSAPNYETPSDGDHNNIYNINVQVSDGLGGIDTQAITITVTNVNEAPRIENATPSSVPENSASGIPVYDVNDANTGTDYDVDGDKIVYSITGGNTGGVFQINSATGVISVAAGHNLDYETQTSYSLAVSASANGQSDPATITVNISDIIEGPVYNLIYGTNDNDDNWFWEPLELRGTSGNDHIMGWASSGPDNNDGNDVLYGYEGDDWLEGGTQNDYLNGGSGNDLLYGGAGNDELYGGDGDDYLDGGTGNDYMAGGRGNDTYIVDNSSDTVSESNNQGTDTVLSSVSYTINDGDVENLTLTGTGNINATGNGSANTLTGNDGDNTLEGGGGNDILVGGGGIDHLYGGTGNDTLTGGSGADVFHFQDRGNGNVDNITDFTAGAGGDILDISAVLNSGHPSASGLISGGYLQFTHGPGDTVIMSVDSNGGGNGYQQVATFTIAGAGGMSPTQIMDSLINHNLAI